MAANDDGPTLRAIQALVAEALANKSDAEVLSFVAAHMGESPDPLSQYLAQRLEAVAILLEAQEAAAGGE